MINGMIRTGFMLCCIVSLGLTYSCSDSEYLEKNYLAGKQEYAKGNLDSALNYLNKVDKEDSGYLDTPLYLAKIEFYKGNFNKVEDRLDDVLEDSTLGFQAKLWKLKAGYASGGDRKVLLDIVDKLLLIDSSNLDLLILSAKINMEMGKIPDAIRSYNRVIIQEDKISLAKKQLALIYGKIDSDTKDLKSSVATTSKRSQQSKNKRK